MTTERAPRPAPPPRTLGALLPVEAFARSLHSKLRSLGGSQDDVSSESWSTAHARTLSSSSVDSNSDIFFDLDLSPQSPEEEVTASELAGMIAGSGNVDSFQSWPGPQSPQSDCSSDYFDPDGFDDDRRPQSPGEDVPQDEVCGSKADAAGPNYHNGQGNGLMSPLSAGALPYECNQCYSIVLNGVTPYDKPYCRCPEDCPDAPAALTNGSLTNGGGQPSPSPPSPVSPSKKRPWNRVQHRYKAGTPEAMREVSQMCLEEADDADEDAANKPSPPRASKSLPKLNFAKSSETILQEGVIEQLKQGGDIPPELKNGLCPRLSGSEAVAAPGCRGLAAMKLAAEALDALEQEQDRLADELAEMQMGEVEAVEACSGSEDAARREETCRLKEEDGQAEDTSIEDGPRIENGITNGESSDLDDAVTTDEPREEVPSSKRRSRADSRSRSNDVDGADDDDSRPRIRRCSSLKTGKTPPGTPSRKKIVRFADVLGLDLADVRTFMDEIPKVPTSAYDDLQGVEPVPEQPPVPQLALAFQTAPLAPVETFGVRPTRMLVPLFQQPGGMADFLDKVRDRRVCLENALVKDASLLSIAGQVRVRNMDFHKTVHIRYTTDCWDNFADLQATYVPNSCDGFSDKFTFLLFAAHTMSVGQRLEMAVRFQCKGQQYWDNNGGSNYCFQCLPFSGLGGPNPLALPSPDDSWKSFY